MARPNHSASSQGGHSRAISCWMYSSRPGGTLGNHSGDGLVLLEGLGEDIAPRALRLRNPVRTHPKTLASSYTAFLPGRKPKSPRIKHGLPRNLLALVK